MKKISIAVFLIFAGSVFLCAQKKAGKETLCISEEESLIYKKIDVGNFQNATDFYSNSDLAYLKGKFPGISPETVADYRSKNDKSYLLRCLDRKEGEPKKLKRSISGTKSVIFSRIGFNNRKTEALVYSGSESAGNNCEYGFILLRKNKDLWEIIESVSLITC